MPSPHRLLSREEKARLRHLVEAIERETGVEVATLIIRHTDDVAAYGRAYFDHVGVGKRGHDTGVLVLVALDGRQVRIELGRGLAGIVQPEDAQRIIDHVIAPQFRQGRYGDGLVRGIEALGHLVRASQPPA